MALNALYNIEGQATPIFPKRQAVPLRPSVAWRCAPVVQDSNSLCARLEDVVFNALCKIQSQCHINLPKAPSGAIATICCMAACISGARCQLHFVIQSECARTAANLSVACSRGDCGSVDRILETDVAAQNGAVRRVREGKVLAFSVILR